MKKLLLTMAGCFAFVALIAQTGFNYQAAIRDNSGNIEANSSVTLSFSIIETSPGGTTVYAEDHSATTNDFGIVNVVIGEGTPTTGTFSSIDWAGDDHFLKVEVDGNDMGTTQFVSVPYAKVAENVANPIWDEDGDGINAQKHVSVGSVNAKSADYLTVISGSNTGEEMVDMRVTNLKTDKDLLNLFAGPSSSDTAQLIEGSKGTEVTFKVDVSGDIYTKGTVNTDYGAALPIAYAAQTGEANIMYGVDSITNPTTGQYDVYITKNLGGVSSAFAPMAIVSNYETFSNDHTLSWDPDPVGSGGKWLIQVRIYDISLAAPENSGFSIIVYGPDN